MVSDQGTTAGDGGAGCEAGSGSSVGAGGSGGTGGAGGPGGAKEVKGRGARWVVAGVLLLLVAVGAFMRFWRLGALGLIVDEGYQAGAVAAILKHGYPILETGLVYIRSPIFLYLQSACVYLLGFNEFAMRLPAAVFSVLGIPVAYWFGRSLFNWRVGLVLAAFMALSAWELEYARYARFYSLLQMLYLVGLVAWFRGFVQMQVKWRWVFAAVFWLTIVTHHLGVMLGLSFLVILPLMGYTLRRRAVYFVLSGVCGVAWMAWNSLFDKYFASIGTLPRDVRDPAATTPLDRLPTIKLPGLLFLELVWAQNRGVQLAGAAATTLISMVLVWLTWRGARSAERGLPGAELPGVGRNHGWWLGLRMLLVVGIAWCGLTHMAALAMVLGVIYLACFVRRWRELLRPELVVACVTAWVGMAAWVVWFRLSPHASLTAGLEQMLSFPGLYSYFFKWTVYGWPVMLVLWGIGFIVLARRAVTRDDRCNAYWFLLGVTLLPMAVTSQLAWKFSESRYFFHLYPLLLTWVAILVVAAADAVGRWWKASAGGWRSALVTSAVTAVLLVICRDTNPVNAWAVSSREYDDYRDPIRAVLNFRWHADFHQDLKTASERARPLIAPEDHVVVVGPPHQAVTYRHYVGRVDYIVASTPSYDNVGESTADLKTHLKSGGTIISKTADLVELRRQAEAEGRTLWLFSDRPIVSPECWFVSDAEKSLKAMIIEWMGTTQPLFVGLDEKTTVHRLPPGLAWGSEVPADESGG